MPKSLEDGILVGFHNDSYIIEKEIISNDFQKEIAFRLNDRIDHLKAFLGQAVDDGVP
jgi:hypothetical protein